MPYKCVVPGCNSGYKTCKTKRHMFKVPKRPELRDKWQKAIPRDDFILRDTTRVCDLHFERRFIQTNYAQTIGEHTVRIPRAKPRLAPDAVPTIFLNPPGNMSRKYRSRNSKKSNSTARYPNQPFCNAASIHDRVGSFKNREKRSASMEKSILSKPENPVSHLSDDEKTPKISSPSTCKLTSFRLKDLKEMYKFH